MNEQLANGLVLLGTGMGFVLCFLVIMIFVMGIMTLVVSYLNTSLTLI